MDKTIEEVMLHLSGMRAGNLSLLYYFAKRGSVIYICVHMWKGLYVKCMCYNGSQ